MEVVVSPHPICPAAGRRVHAHRWQRGQTVREVLKANGVDPRMEIVVRVNDRLLKVKEWDVICPQPEDLIQVQAVTSGGGGGGGSNPLRIVLIIVVIIASIYFGPWVGAQLGFSGATAAAVGSAIISFAGMMLVNAIVPLPKLELGRDGGSWGGDKTSPTYSLSGGSNRLRPYEPLPLLMGEHRIFPDAGSRPYTEFRGEDQYLYQIFNFGLSDLELSDFRIGETPISQYQDVTFIWPDADGKLPNFPTNVDTSGGTALIRGADWVVRTSSPHTVALAVDIEGVLYYSGDAGLLSCQATVAIEYRAVGSPTWLPMASSSVTAYGEGYWSRGYYENVYSYDWGGEGGTYVSGLAWRQVAYGSTNPADHVDGSSAGLYSPSAFASVATTWRWRPYSEILTNGNGSALTEPAPPQPRDEIFLSEMNVAHGASQKPQRRTVTISVPKGQYEVRVRLPSAGYLTGGAYARPVSSGGFFSRQLAAAFMSVMTPTVNEFSLTDSRGGVQYSFNALRSFQEDTATYKDQKRLGLIVKASGQLNGAIQQLSALGKASTYYWDEGAGEWKYGKTSNPAWWFLAAAVGKRNAAGKLLWGCGYSLDQVDVEALQAWAAFCNDQGLTFNAVFDSAQTVSDMLDVIARCGFASKTWATGKLGVVWDAPNQAHVAVFGMSNICKGSFSVEYATENMADEITVNYVDPSDWTTKPVRAMAPGVEVPVRPTNMDLKGCTSEQMAGKYANMVAAQQYYRRRRITWETDFEGFTATRGDVVLLSHDLTQWGYSGRLVAVDGNLVTLEREVPRSGAAEWLLVRKPNGEVTTYDCTPASGEGNVLELDEPVDLQEDYGPVDHVWFFGPESTPGKKVKITSVKPLSESRVRITATDEYQEFYAAWDGSYQVVKSPSLLKDPVPQLNSVRVSEALALVDGLVVPRVTVAWNVVGPLEYVSVRWRIAGGSWQPASKHYGASASFDLDTAGLFEAELTPVNGPLKGALVASSRIVYGKTLPPSDVANFALAANGINAVLTMNAAGDLDVVIGGALVVRFYPDTVGATWEKASDLAAFPGSVTSVTVPLMAGTYLAKWVDSSGNVSESAALIMTDASTVLGMNVVASISAAPAWSGTKSGTWVNGFGELALSSAKLISEMGLVSTWPTIVALDGVAQTGSYNAGVIDLGGVYPARVRAEVKIRPYDAIDRISARGLVSSWPSIVGDLPDDAWAEAWFRYSSDNVTWSAWQALAVQDVTARYFEFRLDLFTNASNHNVAVEAADFIVDMPDRTEAGNDIPSGGGPYVVTFGQPFKTVPAVAITAQGMATGDYYQISKTAAGFTVTFRNSAGTAVNRTFDYIAKGY